MKQRVREVASPSKTIFILAVSVLAMSPMAAQTQASACTRPAQGSTVDDPGELRSTSGLLYATLDLRRTSSPSGQELYCYIAGGGLQSPTLRIRPADELVIELKNDLPSAEHPQRGHLSHDNAGESACGGGQMTSSSTNLHFHGMNIPPTCHQDDTLRTLIQPDDPPFEYHIKVPKDQPPGLYWYHPHPHGFTEEQVLGGASGALIVEGIEKVNPKVSGLAERILIFRDQMRTSSPKADEERDISINYVPVSYPRYEPARLVVRPIQREFWRLLNASADTYLDLEVRYQLTDRDVSAVPSGFMPLLYPQSLEIVAVDGAPIGTQKTNSSHVLLAPGARVEFIVTTPPVGKSGLLVTRGYNTGPSGDDTPYRVIANIQSREDAPPPPGTMPQSSGAPRRFLGLASATPVRTRTLYFSEDLRDPKNPRYFITVAGAQPKTFSINFQKPDITARQGTVEDWFIENRAQEAHTFHIHQIHFQLLERDGQKVNEAAMRDTVDLPFWPGLGSPYPSVKIRMDFRAPEIQGTFVFHCHILEHEDAGMMGSIRVVR
jgi:FtsP/CotA-like multicopper oxidase with cupredoxin domain